MRSWHPRGTNRTEASVVQAPLDCWPTRRDTEQLQGTQRFSLVRLLGRKEVWSLGTRPSVRHRVRIKLEHGSQRGKNDTLDLRER